MDRFHSSAGLLDEPFKPGEAGFDKIFILAKVQQDEKGDVTLFVDKETPTVALNPKVNEALGIEPPLPCVAHYQKEAEASPYMLISAGCFLWVREEGKGEEEDRMILLKRDAGAPSMAGHWTEPAGRCGDLPQQVMADEAHEELAVYVRAGQESTFRPVTLENTTYQGDSPAAIKSKQSRDRSEALEAAGLPLDSLDHSSAYPARLYERSGETDLYRNVTLRVAGEEKASFRAICLFDGQNNTLELRQSALIELPAKAELRAIDGECYDRKTGLFTLAEIARAEKTGEMKLCPALSDYTRHASVSVPNLPRTHKIFRTSLRNRV